MLSMDSNQINSLLEPSVSTVNAVARLFSDWKRVFTTKIKEDQYDLRTIELWVIALQQLEITDDEFNLALALSTKEAWPPSTPADFVNLVRGSKEDNYPNAHLAYIEAANDNYIHVVCYETTKRFGFYSLVNQDKYRGFEKWKSIYAKVCEEHYQDSAKFEKIVGAVPLKKGFDKLLEHTNNNLEIQSSIAKAALQNIRNLL